MPVRMLRYLTDLLMARPGLPVRQCLIYIGKARCRWPLASDEPFRPRGRS